MKGLSIVFITLWMISSISGCSGGDSESTNRESVGIVSGQDGLLVFTTDNGAQWRQLSVPGALTKAYFSGVAFSPDEPRNVWVVSGDPPAIMTSQDYGDTWALYEGDLYGCLPHFIKAADTQTAWVSCDSPDTGQPLALKTEDGGETWIPQEAGLPLTEKDIIL